MFAGAKLRIRFYRIQCIWMPLRPQGLENAHSGIAHRENADGQIGYITQTPNVDTERRPELTAFQTFAHL